jgi:hypothetical protein
VTKETSFLFSSIRKARPILSNFGGGQFITTHEASLKYITELVSDFGALWSNSEGAPKPILEGAPKPISEGVLKTLCEDALPKPSTGCAVFSEDPPYHFSIMKVRSVYGASVLETFKSIHEAIGHPSLKQFLKATLGVNPTWPNCSLTMGQIRKCYRQLHC